ncbi:MAG: phosphotransferase [Thermodesulfobacteriota bacterium]
MIIEMHCHSSEYSRCSHVTAVDLVRRVFELGLQGIVLTDHHHLWSDDALEEIREKAGVQEFFLVLSGQETTTKDFGDVLVFGADRTLPKHTPLAEIRNSFPEAAIVWAHPYRHGHTPDAEKLLHPMIDAVEIFSSNQSISESNRALEDWHRHKFTAIGGTDAHALSYAGTYPTLFDHPVTDITALAEEIRAGRCRPYFREIPRLGTSHTRVRELRIGPNTGDGGREELIVKNYETHEEWRDAKRTFHILNTLIDHGFDAGEFRVPKPLDEDPENRVLIEQSVNGEILFDRICKAEPKTARKYLQLAGRWLAAYHNLKLALTPAEEFLEIEPQRLNWYIKDIYRNDHKNRDRIREILEAVLNTERILYQDRPERVMQGHGDFHPKNIFIGQDDLQDSDSVFAAVIDFDSSFQLPRAFDVGTFIAQYRNQFFSEPHILQQVPEDIFLKAYMEAADELDDDFGDQVTLFHARTCLSILYYLYKVGMGDSENFWKVQVEAEHSINHIAVHYN